MAAETVHQSQWEWVIELTKSSQAKNSDPLHWAMKLSAALSSGGASLPSGDLAHILVSHICWANHVPIAWKYLEKAIAVKIVPPMLVLALLSTRVIPSRRVQPTAYRLYIELLKRHAFSFASQVNGPNYETTMKSIDEVLHLSQIFGLKLCEPGLVLVEFIFSTVWQLLDASLDDEGLLELTPDKKSRWLTSPQDMEIDGHYSSSERGTEHHEGLHKVNTAMAIRMIGEFLQNKTSSRILYLARQNMPSQWRQFIQRLRLLAANSVVLRNLKDITPDDLLQLTSDAQKVMFRKCKTASHSQEQFHAVLTSGSLISSAGQCHGASWSALWLPFDLFLEDAMDGSQVAATSAIENLMGIIKALQAVNNTTWDNTFLGLWLSALRLIQRERDPSEGPVPRVDTCLCMLLSITILAVASIIEEEESELIENECGLSDHRIEKPAVGKRRKSLISSLQLLADYESLLIPPQLVCSIANQAASKAILFVSGLAVNNGYSECMGVYDMPMNCSGNMRHLIVEACIARNILDTSAYFWPGYVSAQSNRVPHCGPAQMLGWSSLMKGSPLTPAMTNALVATPASSLAEIEKLYEFAVTGSDDDKVSVATILCGASLIRGWKIQEHTILFITKMLSPPVPAGYSRSDSHLIRCAPFLNVLLVGISSVDCVHIFSLHGLAPHLAGALMPLCEVFGSAVPEMTWALPTGEELSCHAVFSNAFTLLLRLWRFNHPPLEHVMGDVPPVGSQLCPEYLLMVRNCQLSSFGNSVKDRLKLKRLSKILNFSAEPVFMETFPKLKRWYRQNQECIASTPSTLEHGTPVQQIGDALLNMMFRKVNKSGQAPTPSTSGSSNSSASLPEDVAARLKVPAWDILEATPFVLDAALTACGHGQLSPRELATGLKDLADFLPATLATIVSYFSAEVTRGIWKPAFMNGTDWPSPAANLSTVEQQIKKILAGTGVDVPSLAVGGSSTATLPLPLAALVSLTITYKLDKASERFLVLVGPALNSLACGCPWPCMPVIASLWSQKVKRWSDFLVFSASNTVFHNNSDAVVQLLKSCFASAISSNGGIGALLGHGFGSHLYGGISPVAPGFLYLRVHRSVRDTVFMTEEIVSLLMLSVREIAGNGGKLERLRNIKHGARYGQVSLAAALTRVRFAASLGASLVWITGGLSLVQSLIKETLPSWFISNHRSEREFGDNRGTVTMLRGYALAYFAVLSGAFAWGVDSASTASKRRAKVLGAHMEFLASAIDGKISLGCDWATWRAYVSGFVSLTVACTPKWVLEVDPNVVKRLSKGLRRWNEEELALALLVVGGVGTMGEAAQLIVESGF